MKKIASLLFLWVSMATIQASAQAQIDPKGVLKNIFQSLQAPLSNHADDVDMSPAVAGALQTLSEKGYRFGTDTPKTVTLSKLKAEDFQIQGVLAIVKEEKGGSFQGSIRMYLPIDAGNGHVEAANVYVFIFGSVDPKTGVLRIQKFEVNFKGVS